MFYLFEKYFVAMPQFYGWFYLQRFFGLQEWCDLQKDKFPSGNDVYKYECFQFAFIFKTIYLVWISSFLLAQPVISYYVIDWLKGSDESSGAWAKQEKAQEEIGIPIKSMNELYFPAQDK